MRSEWVTTDELSEELKVPKSVIYAMPADG
jgi:predicted transcriptional regulator